MVESVLPLTAAAALLPSLGRAGSLHCGSHGYKNVCCLCFVSPLQESSSAVPHKKKNVKTCHCSATLSFFKSLNNYGLNRDKKTELTKNSETGDRKCSCGTALFPAEHIQGSFPTRTLGRCTNYASGQETYYLQSSCLKINKHFRSCFSIHSASLRSSSV